VPGTFPGLGGKDGQYVGLTTIPPSFADCQELLEPQPPGTLGACPGIPLPLLHNDIAAATSLFRTAAISVFFLVANIKHYDVVMTISVFLTKYYSGVQIEKNEIGGACSRCGGEERCIQGFGGGNLRE
jgi:hypothetical protein